MKRSIIKGLSFGFTSGIITTLGMIVGLSSTTHSKIVVIGGVLSIAVADSFSDALGIHISEESTKASHKNVWIATFCTFISKLLFSLTFLIPILLFDLGSAIIVSIIWGIGLLSLLSYLIAKNRNVKPFSVILEHVIIAVIVIFLTHFVGLGISRIFV